MPCGPAAPTLVTVSSDAWTAIRNNPEAPRGSYLSLLDWKERWLEQGMFPFTPLVSDVVGLAAACDDLLLGIGLDSRRPSRAASRACRAGISAMGLEIWPRREEIASPTVTSIRLPDELNDLAVRAHARDRYGVMLSGAQGAGNLVRIGHMGITARGLHVIVGLVALGQTLADLGASVDLGAGVEAAEGLTWSRQPGWRQSRRLGSWRGERPDLARRRDGGMTDIRLFSAPTHVVAGLGALAALPGWSAGSAPRNSQSSWTRALPRRGSRHRLSSFWGTSTPGSTIRSLPIRLSTRQKPSSRAPSQADARPSWR